MGKKSYLRVLLVTLLMTIGLFTTQINTTFAFDETESAAYKIMAGDNNDACWIPLDNIGGTIYFNGGEDGFFGIDVRKLDPQGYSDFTMRFKHDAFIACHVQYDAKSDTYYAYLFYSLKSGLKPINKAGFYRAACTPRNV